MKALASVKIRTILITSAEGAEVLVAELEIDCEECGTTGGAIMGHHLRTVHHALGLVIAQYPELCGEIGEVKENLQFSGGHTPGSESLN